VSIWRCEESNAEASVGSKLVRDATQTEKQKLTSGITLVADERIDHLWWKWLRGSGNKAHSGLLKGLFAKLVCGRDVQHFPDALAQGTEGERFLEV
jgi:hypothetical protein